MNTVTELTQSKREQIYQAAVREFQEKGFREARMDSICAISGVSKRTVYKYFDSKEDLFLELIRRHWTRFENALEITYDPNRPIRDQLMDMGWAEGKLLTDAEVMGTSRLVMSEVLRSPELVERNEEKTDFKAAFVALMAEAINDGQLAGAEAQQLADEFLSLIKGKAFWPVIFGAPVLSKDEMGQIIESSVEMMLSRYATGA